MFEKDTLKGQTLFVTGGGTDVLPHHQAKNSPVSLECPASSSRPPCRP